MITIRQMRGLGRITQPGSFLGASLPVLAGVGLTGIGTLATRYFAKPAEGDTPKALFKWAPLIGAGVGALGSGVLYWLAGAPAMVASLVASVLTAGAQMAHDQLIKNRGGDWLLAFPPDTAEGAQNTVAGLGRLGVVVPQRLGAGARGIVMEPVADRNPYQRYGVNGVGAGQTSPYGEAVSLGNINPSAFGTPGFKG